MDSNAILMDLMDTTEIEIQGPVGVEMMLSCVGGHLRMMANSAMENGDNQGAPRCAAASAFLHAMMNEKVPRDRALVVIQVPSKQRIEYQDPELAQTSAPTGERNVKYVIFKLTTLAYLKKHDRYSALCEKLFPAPGTTDSRIAELDIDEYTSLMELFGPSQAGHLKFITRRELDGGLISNLEGVWYGYQHGRNFKNIGFRTTLLQSPIPGKSQLTTQMI